MEDSWANQKSIQDLGLNKDGGAKLIAVVRKNEIMTNLLPEFRFQPTDTLVLFGRHAPLDRCVRYLQLGENTAT
jgi:K+/H+ antiporter YhaU regulatory subunit KhtT